MIKPQKVIWALATTGLFFVGCAGQKPVVSSGECNQSLGGVSVDERAPVVKLPPIRHLAWLEGDYQTDYEPNRTVAETKLAKWDGKVPDPSQTDAYLEYLSVLDASGRPADVEKKIKKYLADNPNEKRAVFLLGVHYMRRGKRDLAQHFFGQLEKEAAFPWKSLLFNNLGMLALKDSNRSLAIEFFEKATKAQPPTAAPFVNLGALYLQSRSFVEAERLFRSGLNIDEDFEDAALGLGSSLEGQGKFDAAHQTYSSFMDSHSEALSVLYNDAIILGNRLKRREEAAQVMLRYIQRGGKETAKAHEIIQTWR